MKWILGGMALLAVISGAFSGRMDGVSRAALEEGGHAVRLVLELTGSLCLWSGLMEIARAAGITRAAARLLRPAVRFLFPSLTDDPDTMGLISFNMTANLLGLGNAATPFGLQAMRRLNTRAPHPGTASDEMITLLVLNSCSLQLIPATAASLRLAAGSADPMAILPASLAASAASLLTALGLSRLISRASKRNRRRQP